MTEPDLLARLERIERDIVVNNTQVRELQRIVIELRMRELQQEIEQLRERLNGGAS